MSQAKNSTQVLRAVEWILTNVGWSQNANFRDKQGQILGSSCISSGLPTYAYSRLGSVCLHGALLLVETTEKTRNEALARLNAETGLSSVIGFNDRSGTTKERVLALVRRAIKKGSK